MFKIGMVDDDAVLLQSFKNFFEYHPTIECVTTISTIEGLLRYLRRDFKIDFLFLDIYFPDRNAVEVIGKIKKLKPDIEIIMYTVSDDDETIFQALSAGATGYLLKSSPLEDIPSFLENTINGGAIISPRIARKVINYFTPKAPTDEAIEDKLSPLTLQVLKYLADGKSYKLIAKQVGLSVDGVRYHIKKIYKQLHVNSKGEAIRKYLDGKVDSSDW
ncbi:MAG: response regulator transcription factor [Bacteroidota bacterium]